MTWDLFAMARLTRALIVPVLAAGLTGAGMMMLPLAAQAAPSAVSTATSGAALQRHAGIEIAQSYGLPPADVGGGDGGGGDGGGDGSGSAADVVRISRLEDQVRQLNGQIQQLQFANRQLQDQMRKFQQDVEFRFQELGGRRGIKLQKRSEVQGLAPAVAPPVAAAVAAPASRDDAFDPAKDPGAPGVPRALGSPADTVVATPAAGGAATPSGDGGDDAPINLLSSPPAGAAPVASDGGATPGLRPSVPGTQAAVTTPSGTVIADRQANSPKQEYDLAISYLKQKDYEDAERGFSAFLAKNPKSRHTSDAIYYLGETYYLRGRQREAAEQYLKISAHYPNSPRAPEAMLRLGESLRALGAKEQACATFSEVPRKYPNASAAIKAGAERAAKRAQC